MRPNCAIAKYVAYPDLAIFNPDLATTLGPFSMQASQKRWIRRRKFELYERLLPELATFARGADLENDSTYLKALENVVRLAPSGFGANVGNRRRLSDLGVLGHVTLSCSTLREVIDLWLIFSDNAAEPITFSSNVDTSEAKHTWCVSIRPSQAIPSPVADFLVDELTAAFFVFGRETTGIPFDDFETELTHGPCPGVDYAMVLPGGVRFNQPVARLRGPADALDRTIDARRDEPLAMLVEQLGGDEGELRAIQPATRDVYEFLIRRRTSPPTLEAAAEALHVSERTLVRRLADEDTRFGAVLDDFRHRYTLTLLKQGGLQPKQIAHLVGFQSESGLRKAFLKWTGRPIGAWAEDVVDRSDSRAASL